MGLDHSRSTKRLAAAWCLAALLCAGLAGAAAPAEKPAAAAEQKAPLPK